MIYRCLSEVLSKIRTYFNFIFPFTQSTSTTFESARVPLTLNRLPNLHIVVSLPVPFVPDELCVQKHALCKCVSEFTPCLPDPKEIDSDFNFLSLRSSYGSLFLSFSNVSRSAKASILFCEHSITYYIISRDSFCEHSIIYYIISRDCFGCFCYPLYMEFYHESVPMRSAFRVNHLHFNELSSLHKTNKPSSMNINTSVCVCFMIIMLMRKLYNFVNILS